MHHGGTVTRGRLDEANHIHAPYREEEVVDVKSAAPVPANDPFCHFCCVPQGSFLAPVMLKVVGKQHMNDDEDPGTAPESAKAAKLGRVTGDMPSVNPDGCQITGDRNAYGPKNQTSSWFAAHRHFAFLERAEAAFHSSSIA